MSIALFRFYEELNDFLPAGQRKRDIQVSFDPPVPVRHLIETLGVPHTEVELILANGESVGLDHPVRPGERISVYPVFEALDVTPLLRVRSRPLREPRFLADAHLGKLARWLRLMGFDTAFDPRSPDAELTARAVRDGRILLTRDRALLMRRELTHGCYVRQTGLGAQLEQLIRRLDLCRAIRPFTRCMRCNGLLRPAGRDEVAPLIPAGVLRRQDGFWRCGSCGQAYWRGSHFRRLASEVERLCGEASVVSRQ
ncbi:MAG: Mut7-C RNAse domain-containing protein [Chromatiales bacterium]|jgi:uncharacterized protein with PIN domain